MSREPHVALIIPALDEEASIGGVIDGVDRRAVRQLIVADNGSRDRTAAIAVERGAEVIRVAERGYGAACAGALTRLEDSIAIVVFADADGSDDLAEMRALIAPIENDEADLVIGSRALGRVERGALTPQQRIGNRLATFLIEHLYGHRYTDLGPFRAIRRTTLDSIAMQDRRYGWTVEMQMRALQIGARVTEIPVTYRKRIGRSKISGTIGGIAKAAWWILATIWKHRHPHP